MYDKLGLNTQGCNEVEMKSVRLVHLAYRLLNVGF